MVRSTFTTVELSAPTNHDNQQMVNAVFALVNATLTTPLDFSNTLLMLPSVALYSPPSNCTRLVSLSPNTYFAREGDLQLTFDMLQGRGLSDVIDTSSVSQVLIINISPTNYQTVSATLEVIF
jgi:hypothetical protein